MKTLTLIGAGGKMGCRITNNIKASNWKVHYLEVSEPGVQRLKDCGVSCSDATEALPVADVAIFAVPDVAMEAVTRDMIPQLKPGALVILLDPAAPLDGKVAQRSDLGYFIAHPCHPSVFNWEPSEEGFRDFYGGISATIDLFLLHRLGYENLTLYDGSMGEWAKDDKLPIETG